MNRTYVFGCHEQINGLRTFTVNVSANSGGLLSEELTRDEALATACEVAKKEGLPSPTLLYMEGTPEIKVILNDGEPFNIFYRNSALPPTVEVVDIFCGEQADAEQRAEAQELIAQLEADGYMRIGPLVG